MEVPGTSLFPYWNLGYKPRQATFACFVSETGAAGSVKEKTVPPSGFGTAHNLPPWPFMMSWQIDKPIPIPFGFVVTKG